MCHKMKFSYETALRVLAQAQTHTLKPGYGRLKRIYLCPVCHRWHLTSKPYLDVKGKKHDCTGK